MKWVFLTCISKKYQHKDIKGFKSNDTIDRCWYCKPRDGTFRRK